MSKKKESNKIQITNLVQLGIENYMTRAIFLLLKETTGSDSSHEKHIPMKVEREGLTLKLTPLNTCLSPNDL